MHPAKIWLLAARPKTLAAGLTPVLIGTAMAGAAGHFHLLAALAAGLGALLIQIGANFANDYFDFVKGTDTEERVGPTRATQAGLVSPRTMLFATILVFALAFLPGGSGLYRVGLDDFAALWMIAPRQPFEPLVGDYPRRFQITRTDDPGERQFARKCSVCHTLTPDGANRAGPTLHGVFGRPAGTVPGYAYSEAVRDSGVVWSEKTIGLLFELGPDHYLPGTKMPVQKIASDTDRDDLIRFLKRATKN